MRLGRLGVTASEIDFGETRRSNGSGTAALLGSDTSMKPAIVISHLVEYSLSQPETWR
jgi:hypothetical protein